MEMVAVTFENEQEYIIELRG